MVVSVLNVEQFFYKGEEPAISEPVPLFAITGLQLEECLPREGVMFRLKDVGRELPMPQCSSITLWTSSQTTKGERYEYLFSREFMYGVPSHSARIWGVGI